MNHRLSGFILNATFYVTKSVKSSNIFHGILRICYNIIMFLSNEVLTLKTFDILYVIEDGIIYSSLTLT